LISSDAKLTVPATELDAFTDRLRQALAKIDGPPRPGRCDPDCGFLHHEPGPTSVPTELSRRPTAETQAPPIACTLTGNDHAERIHQWQQLLAHAQHRESIDRGLRIDLPATLAAAEQQCCAFFDFTLHLSNGNLQLEVRISDEAAPLLTQMFGTLD
jgi:MerR family transcriptional regulator, copper efflux regulator